MRAKATKKAAKGAKAKGLRSTKAAKSRMEHVVVIDATNPTGLRVPVNMGRLLTQVAGVSGTDVNTVCNVLLALSVVTAKNHEEESHGI